MEVDYLKTMLMSTVEIKEEIKAYLDEVDDTLLEAVHAMLATYARKQEADPIIGYSVEGVPMRASEAKVEFQKRVESVQAGNYTTTDEIRKEMQSW